MKHLVFILIFSSSLFASEKSFNELSAYWKEKIEREALLNLTLKDSLFAELKLAKLPFDFNSQKDEYQKISSILGAISSSLRALYLGFDKKACVFESLSKLQKYASFYDIYLKTDQVEDPDKFEHLKSLFFYYYTSKYMNLKYQKKSVEKVKKEISNLSENKQEKIWDLVGEWEMEWEDPEVDSKNCEVLKKKEQIQIDQKINEVYLFYLENNLIKK